MFFFAYTLTSHTFSFVSLYRSLNIRLADFGLARVLESHRRDRQLTICGTDGFIAPEVMLGMNYTRACDVFSYGMCLANLITRKEPGADYWNRGEGGDLGLENSEFLALVPPDAPKEFVDLTIGCVAFDMEDRPGFADVLEARGNHCAAISLLLCFLPFQHSLNFARAIF